MTFNNTENNLNGSKRAWTREEENDLAEWLIEQKLPGVPRKAQ